MSEVTITRVERLFLLFSKRRSGQTVVGLEELPIGAMARRSKLPSNASQTMNRGGFTVAPGQRNPQSLSVTFSGGLIFHYLIFSAAKGVIE